MYKMYSISEDNPFEIKNTLILHEPIKKKSICNLSLIISFLLGILLSSSILFLTYKC